MRFTTQTATSVIQHIFVEHTLFWLKSTAVRTAGNLRKAVN